MDEQPGGGGGMAAQRQQQQQPAPQQGNNGINPQMASSGGAPMVQQQDEMPRPQQYTIPGILHYIQHEWARFEMERAHWEVERAELQVTVTLTYIEFGVRQSLRCFIKTLAIRAPCPHFETQTRSLHCPLCVAVV